MENGDDQEKFIWKYYFIMIPGLDFTIQYKSDKVDEGLITLEHYAEFY